MYTLHKVWSGFVLYLIVILTLIIAPRAKAELPNNQDPLIQVKDLYITGKQFTGNSQWPLLSDLKLPSQLRYGLDLTLNTNFLFLFYFNSVISSIVDQDQFRTLNYKFEVGARILPCLYIEYGHNSWHVFDAIYPSGYQVYDYVGFRLNFINSSKDSTLFWYFDKVSE